MTKSEFIRRISAMAVFFGFVFFFAGGGPGSKLIGTMLFIAGVGGMTTLMER